MTDQGSIIVFQFYDRNSDDVNPDFPRRTSEGVSSAIVLGGTFNVFTGTSGNGLPSTLTSGEYPTPAEMRMPNDLIQSIRKLQ